jgi:hypothetical protein
MTDLLLEGKQSKFISNFENPFKIDKVEKIQFTIEKYSYPKRIKYESYIRFVSGDTGGYQYLEANSLQELIEKTELFIKSL